MQTIQFGKAEKYDSGRSCRVATNTNLAVEVHNSQASSNMWYRIGRIDGATVNWDNSHNYSSGYKPSIAINNNNVVVEVHETSNVFTSSMYYKVGSINGNTIDWGGDDDYDKGHKPSVAINDNNVVVEVHETSNKFTNSLYYRVGQINGNSIDWGSSHKYDSGLTPKVSINNHGQVVEVHKSQGFSNLYYRVGQINGKNIDWGDSHEYQDGVSPSIGLTDNGKVVEVHESEGITGLWQIVGQVNGNTINWGSSSNFDSGAVPDVAVSSEGDAFVQVHEGSAFGLWYSNSRLIDRANFLGEMMPLINNLPLKKMVLPATHDTGMYTGGMAGRTQDLNLHGQLSAGARYFDLRVDGNLTIRHSIIYGPPLSEVLNDIKRFYQEGHQELAILKFSHFDNFSEDSYQNMRNMINSYLGEWLFKEMPAGASRLADISMGTYLNSGGKILVVVDDDWAIDYPEAGYWVYRDWNSGSPEKGDFTVFDQYSNTTDLGKMESDQLKKLNNFDGKCEKNSSIPCDLFLLSWTLTPVTGVWLYAQDADRVLGREMMSQRAPNQYGYFANLLYLDYAEYARPAFVAKLLLASYNNLR